MKELEDATGLEATLLIGLKGYLSEQLAGADKGHEEHKSELNESQMKELRAELSQSENRA